MKGKKGFQPGHPYGKRFEKGNRVAEKHWFTAESTYCIKNHFKPGNKNWDNEGSKSSWFKNGHEYGLKAIETRVKNLPYVWKGEDFEVHFLSKEELLCAQKILTKPIPGTNCKIYIDRHQIDFFPQPEDKMFQGKLVEFHPCPQLRDPRTLTEYYMDRWIVIQNSSYKDTPLVLITSLSELNRSSF